MIVEALYVDLKFPDNSGATLLVNQPTSANVRRLNIWKFMVHVLLKPGLEKFEHYYAEYIISNAGLDEAHAGIKIAERNINNLRYADDTILRAESEEELKSLLMKVKEEREKAGLKQRSKNNDHGIQSHHFMANRWGNNGNSDRLYFWGLQNHCRW
ncbi:overexpressed in colon carcinoma 1 protein homolog isoform X2 [Bos taurus]|uniref:overexpressed in colon carcinoma 1 protein homolog isoform X2 n=1 Tax=Bos taurus TaxID=9913 RepID=UPI0028CB56A8|nr:overexpressed in colon carcinoma 1 protein homolog isoform X2 [Bos taurus]